MKPIEINWTAKRKRKQFLPYVTLAVIGFMAALFTSLFDIVPATDTGEDNYIVETVDSYTTVPEGELNVTFVDVGQGSCTLIYNNDEAIMIDTGMYTEYDNVCKALDDAGITEIDCLVLTHPDADHISGAVELTEDRDYVVKSVMQVYGITNDTDTYEMVQNNIDEFGIPVINPTAGDVYEWCNATFTVLGPVVTDQNVYNDTNSYSIVMRMDYGETSFLFTGDAPTTEMNDIIAKGYDIDVDIYQLSHHGSFNNCNNYSHLKAASPVISIASCGFDNSYGFPHDEVVAYMKLGNIQLYRTDMDGTILVTTNGTKIYAYDEASWRE